MHAVYPVLYICIGKCVITYCPNHSALLAPVWLYGNYLLTESLHCVHFEVVVRRLLHQLLRLSPDAALDEVCTMLEWLLLVPAVCPAMYLADVFELVPRQVALETRLLCSCSPAVVARKLPRLLRAQLLCLDTCLSAQSDGVQMIWKALNDSIGVLDCSVPSLPGTGSTLLDRDKCRSDLALSSISERIESRLYSDRDDERGERGSTVEAVFRLALEEPAGRPIRRAAQSSSSLRARVSEGLARWDAALEAAPGLSPLAAALAWLRPWLAGLCATPSHSQLLCAHIARDLVDDCRHLYARVSVDACGACGAEGLGGLLRGEWGGWWRRRLLGHIVGGAAGSNADPSGHSLGLRAIAAALLAETRRVAGRSTAGCAVVLCCAAAALCAHTSLAMTDVDALLAACAALAPTDCPARPAVETCVEYV